MKISNLTLSPGESETNLKSKAYKKAGTNEKSSPFFRITKKSIDARDKNDVKIVYSAEISDAPFNDETLPLTAKRKGRVLVVGAGPAGLFCSLTLVRGGMDVTLIERGKPVSERKNDVNNFVSTRRLNTESNVQFGEGGAGAFSDGKLNTQVNSPLIIRVLRDFVRFGAPEEIAYLSKPHIGSDRLPAVVSAIREEIKRLGGRVIFSEKLTDINIAHGRAKAKTSFSDEDYDEIVLALGHSARDTFYMLNSRGVYIEQKAFAMGFRIEHPQSVINFSQYGRSAGLLPPADYKLVSHAGERSVFTFCMCPGGVVMPAASEENAVVTNGMSNYLRDGQNANSAIISEIRKEDFPSSSPLAGIDFQREIERKTFEAGGRNYSAPAAKVGDFLRKRGFSSLGTEVTPTYPLGVTPYPLHKLLPESASLSIASAITDMDRRLHGFANENAILTGTETRTSSPVRITRNEKFASVSAENLYPCGEGAGYAGGISSAAADGIKVAEAILKKYGADESPVL